MLRLTICAAMLGCGSAKPTEPPAPTTASRSSELSPVLAPLAWMLGDWAGAHGTEHWVAANGAMFGVGFGKKGDAFDGTFDLMIIDDGDGPGHPDGILRFLASPNGTSQVEFRRASLGIKTVRFNNDAHDFPQNIAYHADDEGLGAEIDGEDKGSLKRLDFAFKPGKREPAPDLEAADRAFAEDTLKRGIAGWVAAFDTDGGMLKKGVRVEGHAAIAELMGPLLSSGTLAWAPIASGRAGKLGFTVGKATFTGRNTKSDWRSSYITIWRRTDAGWKVLFDTGRVVNE